VLRSPALWLFAGLLGIAIGIGVFTFVYAKGTSYLGHDASACANCHVMGDHYDAWIKSSHRAVAECNDCHTPPGLVAKYLTKMENGIRHSAAFTSGDFHEPIRITARNRAVTERACRHCHGDVVQAMIAGESHGSASRQEVSCLRCHSSVGHLGSAGMTALPTPAR
jgi:cytochrome c nitrite reductase small subunit